MTNLINVEDVVARTMLAVLNTGAPRFTRKHKKASVDTNIAHGTGNAAKVLVQQCNHPALTSMAKLHQHAYQVHRHYTLPTDTPGLRLLPAGRELEHSREMQNLKDQHNKFLAEFLADYPEEREKAKLRLNGLFDESVWLPVSEIEGKFKFQTRYLPTPVDGTWSAWFATSIEAAEAELRERLTDALKRVRERCKSDGKLYASVFDDIRDLVDLLPDLDFEGTYAPIVEAMAPLAEVHAEDIRDNQKARNKVAKDAANILSV